ncbi:MAG: thymidine phosphorylase, partial [Nanoarchaeota archaeon]|nr:thymidine phosphorylase [Nanoarchaeota archaeon]
TTPVLVSILAAAGFTVPKTSSRAITSPAGTADTMEVLTNVCLNKAQIQRVVNKTGACLVWGGAVNLAPADDKFITVEYPMSIDSEGQLLASVLAKKGSVGATHVLIDIPTGKGAKVKTRADAEHMRRKFKEVGSALNMRIHGVITDGRQPIGNGIGPAMGAKDILLVLKNDERAPQDLRRKCLHLTAEAFRMHAHIKHPQAYAQELLDSGAAYKKIMQIIRAQGARITNPDKIKFAKYTFDYCAHKAGKIIELDNKPLARTARVAGAPADTLAGLFMHKHLGDVVKKKEPIFTVYAESREKLDFAIHYLKKFGGVKIK